MDTIAGTGKGSGSVVARFPRFNVTQQQQEEPVTGLSSGATNANCVIQVNEVVTAIDYSKSTRSSSSAAIRMSPEGRGIPQPSPSYRVPTKGMRKAYPEDQFVVNHLQSSSPVQHKMEYQPHHHHPQIQTYNGGVVEPSYYPSPPPLPYNNNNDHHLGGSYPQGHPHHPRFYDPHEDLMREYQCLKCGLIFSRESDLHIHYSQDHGFGQGGGGSSASSSSSGSGGNSHSLNHQTSRAPSSTRSGSSQQDMFCDKCQLRFHCLLSFRVHQHEHVLPNVQPHYPINNSHLLSLSYTCEICGANFMSRESLTDHCNAHLFEHVCSESTCGESEATNSSEDFFQGQLHPHQHNMYQHQQHHSLSDDDHQTRHIVQHQHHNHLSQMAHIQQQYQHGMKSDDDLHHDHGGHGHHLGPSNTTPYSSEYSTPPYTRPVDPYHPREISPDPMHSSNKSQMSLSSNNGGGGVANTPSSNPNIYEPLIVMDNGKRRFQCVICKKYLSSRIAHEEHTRGKHTGDKPYSCSYCGKRFAVWNTYKHHMGTHKGGITPLQKCAMCEKRFKTIECLRNHMQREHNIPVGGGVAVGNGGEEGEIQNDGTPTGGGGSGGTQQGQQGGYSCQICGKTFVRKMWRTRHYLSHTGQNCFRCELCSCILPDEQSYRLHHESHKGSN